MADYEDLKTLKESYRQKNRQLEFALNGDDVNKGYKDLAIDMSTKEKAYKKEKAKVFAKLKISGNPVTLIPTLAEGECSDLWLEWRIAEATFHACRENIKRLHTNIDTHQSLLATARAEMAIR